MAKALLRYLFPQTCLPLLVVGSLAVAFPSHSLKKSSSNSTWTAIHVPVYLLALSQGQTLYTDNITFFFMIFFFFSLKVTLISFQLNTISGSDSSSELRLDKPEYPISNARINFILTTERCHFLLKQDRVQADELFIQYFCPLFLFQFR